MKLDKIILDKYVNDILAKAEGTTFHSKGQDMRPTLPYGVRVDIAKSFGSKRSNESNKDYAKRIVEQKYLPEVKKKLGTTWDKMPESMKIVTLDTHFNAGLNTAPSFVKNLKTGNYKEALKDTLDIVGVTDAKTNKEYTSPGLANRRAAAYNLAAKDLNLPTITDTLVSKEGVVSYFTGEGRDVLFSKNIGKPIYPTSKVEFRAPVDFKFKREQAQANAKASSGIISKVGAAELESPETFPLEESDVQSEFRQSELAFDRDKSLRDLQYPANITEPIQVIPNVQSERIPEVVVDAQQPMYRDNEIKPKTFMGAPVEPQNIWRDSQGNPILDRWGGYIYSGTY